MINGGGRALVLHSQRMKMVSYVQPENIRSENQRTVGTDAGYTKSNCTDIQGPYVE